MFLLEFSDGAPNDDDGPDCDSDLDGVGGGLVMTVWDIVAVPDTESLTDIPRTLTRTTYIFASVVSIRGNRRSLIPVTKSIYTLVVLGFCLTLLL